MSRSPGHESEHEDKDIAPTADAADPSTGEAHPDSESEPPVRVVDRRWWARSTGEEEGDDPAAGSSQPSYVAELENRVEALGRQLEEKSALLKEYAAKYTAATRDFDETRARLRREVAKDVDRETRRVLASFLEVVDNLDRAIAAAGPAKGASRLRDGVVMVRQQFLTTLDGHGVRPIDAAGQPFDPNLHDAVSMVPVTETDQDGHVVDVIAPGYRVADEVLRPATVTVGKLAQAAPEPQQALED